MTESMITACYIAASAMFILSLGGLSRQETARRGNLLGIAGMALALVATAFNPKVGSYWWLVGAMVPAVVIGTVLARRVQMTSMPQLVAILHSFVGAAAVLVGIATSLEHRPELMAAELAVHNIEIFVGVCVGSITFTGSIIAFGKLQGFISGAPLLIPARHAINAGIAIATIGLGWWFHTAEGAGLVPLLVATALTGVFGVHFVMAIGGADMPVVVSMLNSYSGWAASAAGFMLDNDLLIVTGALVGSSGAILSIIMCRGMNRSFLSVIMGGFGTAPGAAPAPGGAGG